MDASPARKPYLFLVLLFTGFTAFILLIRALHPPVTISYKVLLTGNFILFLVSLLSYRLNVKALFHPNLQVFLRMVYSSLFMKLIFLSAAAITYVLAYRNAVNKPALFSCFILYFIYTFIEVRLVMQQRKQKNA